MGGHGGLNILPQKSWNVYGRDNRERVARDEAQAAQEQAEAEAARVQAERDQRYESLLRRAARSDAVVAPSGAEAGNNVEGEADGLTGHINFWGDEEKRMTGEEVQGHMKKQAAARERGDPSTQTSDARFDQSFQLASGLQRAADQAWYMQPAQSHTFSKTDVEGGDGRRLLSGAVLIDYAKTTGDPHKEGKHGRKRHKSKDSKKDRKRVREGRVKKVKSKSITELRLERASREATERLRGQRAVLGSTGR